MITYQKNFHHAQKFQKHANNKSVKRKIYALNDKIWLNSKYLKIKQNRKLKF